MDDKIISNISYTNKDFNSIYPELLDLVKRLSNKWDPSLSNESDPGVLLLKLNALIADKNNYNIDKNVLECFPTSVTQDGNARKLYDSLGYNMHWYRSATSTVDLQLRSIDNLGSEPFVQVPLFSMICDVNSSTVYTIYKGVEADNISENNNDIILSCLDLSRTYKARIIEGKCKSYEINGEKNITLDKLDSDYRLYFNEPNVAENGIFIKTDSGSYFGDWHAVDNLQLQRLGTCCFKFGVLPNSNTCYIQFPKDIATLLNNRNASALNINYVLSSGVKGNIKSNYLKTFLKDITIKVIDDSGDENDVIITNQIAISQPNGTVNGADPETIDEAYTNYKRTVGTFDTLVTRKDYENAVFNATSTDGVTNLVSNVVVSDRTSDLNSTLKVQSWSPTYSTKSTLVLNNSTSWDQNIEEETQEDTEGSDSIEDFNTTYKPALNAYDIVFYALSTGDGSYRSTFEPNNNDEYFKAQLQNFLVDNKSVQHNILSLNDLQNITNALYYIYKNIFVLKGQIVTYERVTATEAAEIEDNVMKVLKAKYNSRNLVFGDEIDYATLLDIIQNADSRIKTVALDMPKYQIHSISNGHPSVNTEFGKIIDDNGFIELVKNSHYNEYKTDAYNSNCRTLSFDEKLTLVAKMILAGNVQLFKFDNGFAYDFGFTDVKSVRDTDESNIIPDSYNLIAADTNTKIVLKPNSEYEVKSNELIQAYAPSYIIKKSYTNYVRVLYYNKGDVSADCYKETLDEAFNDSKDYYYCDSNFYYKLNDVRSLLKIANYGTVKVTVNGVEVDCDLRDYIEHKDTNLVKEYFYSENNYTYIKPFKLSEVVDIDNNVDNIFHEFWSLNINKPDIKRLYNYIPTNLIIKAGENHVLTKNEIIRLSYRDENGITQNEELGFGTIIQPTIDLYPKATVNYETVNTNDEIILTATQSLNIVDINECEIRPGYNIYGYFKSKENELVLDKGESYILQEGEYLLYKLNSTSDIVMYGMGTLITNNGTKVNYNWDKIDVNNFDVDDIPWLSLQNNQFLACTELEVVSAGPGAVVLYEPSDSLSNEPLIIENNLSEISDGKLIITPAVQSDSDSAKKIVIDEYPNRDGTKSNYKIQSFLNLYQNNHGYQELQNDSITGTGKENSNSYSIQSIEFIYQSKDKQNTETVKVEGPTNIYFNAVLLTSGGQNIDLSVVRDGTASYSLEAYTFNIANTTSNINLTRDNKGILTIAPATTVTQDSTEETWHKLSLPINFNRKLGDLPVLENGWLIQTDVVNGSGTFKVVFTTTYKVAAEDGSSNELECNVGLFTPNYTAPNNIDSETKDTVLSELQIEKTGSYILWIPNDYDYTNLNIYFNKEATEADHITFGKIKRLAGLNSDEINVIPNDDNNYSVYDYFDINDNIDYKLDTTNYADLPEGTIAEDLSKKYCYNIFRKISDLIKNSSNPEVSFDYTYEVPASDKVLQPTLSSSFFNKNHWANAYTISQIDLDKSLISVNSYSIKS